MLIEFNQKKIYPVYNINQNNNILMDFYMRIINSTHWLNHKLEIFKDIYFCKAYQAFFVEISPWA